MSRMSLAWQRASRGPGPWLADSRSVTELERVRAICLALPEVTERLSHGSPTWFVRGKKTFVTYLDDHHGDGRLALWCAAPEGMQEALVAGGAPAHLLPAFVRARRRGGGPPHP